jgi:TonB family protein
LAEEQFDFHRPSSAQRSGDMIVLRGVIRRDGSVSDLTVLQGIEITTDQLALATFSRWKFTPATRAGQPLDVEVLVGIPIIAPGR